MKNKDLANYVKNRALIEKKIGPFNVIFKDTIEGDVDVEGSFIHVANILPEQYLKLIDVTYLGRFEFLENRDVNAMYVDGSLFISNVQDDAADLIDDIVHEIAHAVEDANLEFIYADGKVENEFILKRAKLKDILNYQGYAVEEFNFLNSEYNEQLDEFFYKELGYDVLEQLSINLYTNPYAATSLREYVASAFEEFYIGKPAFLKQLCPYIYKKLYTLHEKQEFDNER